MSINNKRRRGRAATKNTFYVDTQQVDNSNTPTFSGFAVGEGWSGRGFVAVMTFHDNDGEDITWSHTVTFNGVAGSVYKDSGGVGSGQTFGQVFFTCADAALDGDETIEVAVTRTGFFGPMDRNILSLFVVDNLNPVPHSSDSDVSSASITLNTDDPAEDIVFLGAVNTGSNPNFSPDSPVQVDNTNTNGFSHYHGWERNPTDTATNSYDTASGHTTLAGIVVTGVPHT